VSGNKEFDNIFNECMERLLAGGETIEQCLQRYPAYAKELEPLLRIPYFLSPGWLRIDPTFDPLRRNRRFGKLTGAAK
jgi:hypothetical protein